MSSLTVPSVRPSLHPSPRPSSDRRATTSRHPLHPVPRETYQRRRAVAVVLLVLFAFLVTVAIGRVGAQAGLEDRVAGHVVVEPGQSLWDVAAATAPDGVDTRQQLADLRELNGIDGSHLDAWAVVLLPAR